MSFLFIRLLHSFQFKDCIYFNAKMTFFIKILNLFLSKNCIYFNLKTSLISILFKDDPYFNSNTVLILIYD